MSKQKLSLIMIVIVVLIAGAVTIVINELIPERVDFALMVDGELEDEYLGEIILKAEIYGFSYKIIKPLENLDNYLVTNLILCAEGNEENLTINNQVIPREEINEWLIDIDPVNLILDVDYANSFKPLVPKMNIFASSNLTEKVELLQNIYDYRWSFLGSWLKNFSLDHVETFNEVMMDGLSSRKTLVGNTGVQFWKSIDGHYNTYWTP